MCTEHKRAKEGRINVLGLPCANISGTTQACLHNTTQQEMEKHHHVRPCRSVLNEGQMGAQVMPPEGVEGSFHDGRSRMSSGMDTQ